MSSNVLQAGFNAGGGKGFFNLDYGDKILDIDLEQASELPGQYIYEMTTPTPHPHGCSSKRRGRPARMASCYGYYRHESFGVRLDSNLTHSVLPM